MPRPEARRHRRHETALERPALGLPPLDPAVERAARTLIDRSPLRETGHALLMDALAAQGNIADAMRIYERARTTLQQELGITPGPAIQQAHARLLGKAVARHLPNT